MYRILIVEDDETIGEGIKDALEFEKYIVHHIMRGKDLDREITKFKPHLVIIDIMLPDSNGFVLGKEVCSNYDLPVIFLTARDHISDKLHGLSLGADDYITKPFDLRELILRVKIVIKRNMVEKEVLKVNDKIFIETLSRKVFVDDVEIKLLPKEYELFLYLAQNKGIVITRDKLIENVWGYDFEGNERTVDINIRRLRKKLNDECGCIIETVFGVGYRLVDNHE